MPKRRNMIPYLVAWFPMLLIAICNGILREAFIKKQINDLAAHRLSTVTLLLFFAAYFYFIFKRFPPESSGQAWLIGIVWLVLTLAFEFGFGAYRGNNWDQMLADYNLLKGKLWVLVPLWTLVAPLLFYRFL